MKKLDTLLSEERALDSETKLPTPSVDSDGSAILKARLLRKVYRGRAVVNDLSIEVHPGEVVGLLGPNGAGKTTTFYMVVGLTPPDSGRVFLGRDA